MTARLRRSALLFLIAALAGLGGGCAVTRVQPWDRDLMAKETMRLRPSTIEGGADDHIYFSKEGSVGGSGVGGGGCGCN